MVAFGTVFQRSGATGLVDVARTAVVGTVGHARRRRVDRRLGLAAQGLGVDVACALVVAFGTTHNFLWRRAVTPKQILMLKSISNGSINDLQPGRAEDFGKPGDPTFS